jgi:hypothetical protein
MNPQDDPEARIRQLEQPLADVAQSSELGVGQPSSGVNPTTPLPPPVYGDPYATSPYGQPPYGQPPYGAPPFGVSYPQGPRSGAPVGLIFGLIAVVVVIIFGAVGVIVWNTSTGEGSFSTRSGGETSFARPGGSFDSPPSAEPRIQPSVPDVGSATTAPPGGQLSVSGIDENKTVACNESVVSVSGVNNTVTITGHCVRVTVSGVENKVTIDAADTISASGFDNRVIYLAGDPQIDNFGGSNIVERG